MLVFFFGAFCFILLGDWWAALGCVIGFVVAAVIIRRFSTVEPDTSSEDSIAFL